MLIYRDFNMLFLLLFWLFLIGFQDFKIHINTTLNEKEKMKNENCTENFPLFSSLVCRDFSLSIFCVFT